MVAAPLAPKLAELKVTVATPVASVSAVLERGEIVPKVASVLNVTTALATAVPVASFTVAVTVAEVPLVMDVTDAPPLVSATVKLGAAAVVPVPAAPAAAPLPEPHPARAAIAIANKKDIENLIISLPEKRFRTLSLLFTLFQQQFDH